MKSEVFTSASIAIRKLKKGKRKRRGNESLGAHWIRETLSSPLTPTAKSPVVLLLAFLCDAKTTEKDRSIFCSLFFV